MVLNYGTSNTRTMLFGDDANDVLLQLTAVLGRPVGDTGWERDELCNGEETRRVIWGDLEVVFTRTGQGASAESTFEQWFVGAPGTSPPGLVTLERLGIGSTVADLKRAFPQAEISHPIPGDAAGFFTTQADGNDLIAGITTDTTDTARIVQMWAGAACARIAD